MKTTLYFLFSLRTFTASANPAVNVDERCFEPRDTQVYELTQKSIPSEHVIMADIRTSPPLPMKDDSVAVAGKDNRIYSLLEDGNSRIVFTMPYSKATSPLAVLNDGTIVFGASDNKVYFIDSSGKIKASVNVGNVIEAPAILNDGTIVVVSLDSGIAYFFDQNGAVKAKFTFDRTGPARGPAPLIDGGVVFGVFKKIYFLNANGTMRAVFQVPPADVGIVYSSAVVLNDGTVVVGVGGPSLYFLNPNGTQKAVFNAISVGALTALSNGGVVAASRASKDGQVYFLNSDGTQKAVFKPAYPASSITEMKDGTIVTVSESGQLYILNGLCCINQQSS